MSERHAGDACVAGGEGGDSLNQPIRHESRLPCIPTKALVSVEGKSEPAHAEIHDVSSSGMRLVMDQPIAAGSAVTVESSSMIVAGEIRYCVPTEGKAFKAGLKIDTFQKRVSG